MVLSEQGEAGLQIYVEQEQGGLQIEVEQVEQGQGVCPAEPLHLCQSGSTRPWTISSLIFHGARCNAAAGSRINFRTTFIPKLLLRLLWFFRRTAALFRQIRTFPQLFRFESILGNSGIWAYPTNCEIFNAGGRDES